MIDVAIVGAGLAGLTAAHALGDFDVAVLEQGDRAGGRVLTRSKMGVHYDMGAVLAYDPALFPSDLAASPVTRLRTPAGIVYGGRAYYGQDVRACLQAMGATDVELGQVDRFRDDLAHDVNGLPARLYQILNAAFRDVHFGELADYVLARRRDALQFTSPGHHVRGNGELIDYFVAHLGQRLQLNTTVNAVEDLGHYVRLTATQDGRHHTMSARTAIIATPAPGARRMLGALNEKSKAFLDAVRHAPGTVVALAVRNVALADFSYLVTPELETNTILRRPFPQEQIELLLVYYAGAITAELQQLDNSAVVARTLSTLQTLDFGTIRERNVAFSDVQHWPCVGAIIAPESYGRWDEAVLQPSGRIWLAGDYVFMDNEADPMPYGMQAAQGAGGHAARAVARALSGTHHRASTSLSAHVAQWRDYGYRAAARLAQKATRQILPMTCHPPPPARPFPYGDLVPLGFLLLAWRAKAPAETEFAARTLQNYLLGRRRQKLWAFHARRLITATDSSLVLLGMKGSAVREALDALEAFRDERGGYLPQLWAFDKRPNRMLRIFDNDHWCRPDYGTSCLIFAMRRAAGLPTGNTLAYLRGHFDTRSGLYFANPYLVDWALAMALRQAPQAGDLKQRLAHEIMAGANDDDTFGRFDSPFSTALALAALAALGYENALMQRVRLRLLDSQQRDGLWPAAVPFYSTRRLKSSPADRRQILSLCGQEHALYTYHDSQRMITTSMALLALSTNSPGSATDTTVPQDEPHPRYRCPDHAAYIAQHALPPYLTVTAGHQRPKPAAQKQAFSLTSLDIAVMSKR